MSQVLLFSLTASFNPTLVAVTTVMLMLPSPVKLMAGYLLGAMLASVTLGLLIVFALPDSGMVKTTQHVLSPAADIALGSLLGIFALVLATGRDAKVVERRRAHRAEKGDHGPPRWRGRLDRGSLGATVLLGALLTLPGASYLAALAGIRKLDPPNGATVLLVIGSNLVMLWLIEVPLIGFLVAPERTPRAVQRSKTWVSNHARSLAIRGSAVIGALLVLKGVLGLIA
jgi:Sap, sulfolipid-1-addressing protein